MGAQRCVVIEYAGPRHDVVPQRAETLWRRVYREDALRDQGRKCCWCGEPITKLAHATAEHIIPRSKGGVTSKENIKAACKECNMTKASMSAERFKKIIRNPPDDASIYVRLAHFRYRLWKRVDLMEKRLQLATGVKL